MPSRVDEDGSARDAALEDADRLMRPVVVDLDTPAPVLPGEVALCNLSPSVSGTALALIGLFNIVGSLCAGMLTTRYRVQYRTDRLSLSA